MKSNEAEKNKTAPAPAAGDGANREMKIVRMIDAPREKIYRAWTKPHLLKQWFAPKPWVTSVAELDVRVGGSNFVTIRGPDGQEFAVRGVYLEIVENERIVFTDAYTKAWEPSEKPFMTVAITLEDFRGKTCYTAHVLHWTAADCETHRNMGFEKGWNQCIDQLEALVK